MRIASSGIGRSVRADVPTSISAVGLPAPMPCRPTRFPTISIPCSPGPTAKTTEAAGLAEHHLHRNMNNPFLRNRGDAEKASETDQDRNRLWWEGLPMTYADWSADDRLPESDEDFREIEAYVLDQAPWLMSWFAGIELSGKRCLDLGSGSGIFSCLLGRRGASMTAMDLTENGVVLTRKTAGFFGQHLDVVRGDAERNPFGGGSFDFVFSWGVLHHTNDMESAVREMGRVVAPGGRGLMMVYHRTSVVYYVHGLFWLIFRGKLFQGYNLERVQDFYTDGYYHRYMTRKQLGGMLARAGLRVTDFNVTQYKKKILPFIPAGLDRFLKARFGMCLVARFEKAEGA
jgi:2-polyprenyl-3-methyl-5-hydroxy-6-metoxy-1,4-benzoquinol methylase